MKRRVSVLCVLVLCALLTACGYSFDPSATSLYIHKNGKITQAIVESFEKPYYSQSEFESMVKKEIDAYNSSYGEERITIERLEVKDETMFLLMDYQDADTYEYYNEETCFIGTVDEALAAGYSFDMDFKDKDYVEYTTAEATENKKNSVTVLKEEGIVELEKKVKFVSNNVEIISEHMVQVMPIGADDEYAYIIY